MRAAFGDCVFDTEVRELSRAGARVHLSPKAFQFLEILLERRPGVVARRELTDRLWPETFVSPSGLGRVMAEVRAAIGDGARRPQYIRTAHSFGYAFCGAVREIETPLLRSSAGGTSYRFIWGPREIELVPGENVFGRSTGCAVWLDVPGVSRRHARVMVSSSVVTIEDLASKNGTYVNGNRIEAVAVLTDGDEVVLGAAVMTFRAFPAATSTKTLPRRTLPSPP